MIKVKATKKTAEAVFFVPFQHLANFARVIIVCFNPLYSSCALMVALRTNLSPTENPVASLLLVFQTNKRLASSTNSTKDHIILSQHSQTTSSD